MDRRDDMKPASVSLIGVVEDRATGDGEAPARAAEAELARIKASGAPDSEAVARERERCATIAFAWSPPDEYDGRKFDAASLVAMRFAKAEIAATIRAQPAAPTTAVKPRFIPGECHSSCDDPQCPYIHDGGWYVGEDGPFDSRDEALAAAQPAAQLEDEPPFDVLATIDPNFAESFDRAVQVEAPQPTFADGVEAERKAFEDWSRSCFVTDLDRHPLKAWLGDKYRSDYVQIAWEAWQARSLAPQPAPQAGKDAEVERLRAALRECEGQGYSIRADRAEARAERAEAELAALRPAPSAPSAGAADHRALLSRAVEAVTALDDWTNYNETLFTGWGEQNVPADAEFWRVKSGQALKALEEIKFAALSPTESLPEPPTPDESVEA